MEAIRRAAHPRPDRVRDSWCTLNGAWRFAFDREDAGRRLRWQETGELPLTIQVPFAYQSRMSGIGPTDEIHPILWYRRGFTVPPEMAGLILIVWFFSEAMFERLKMEMSPMVR